MTCWTLMLLIMLCAATVTAAAVTGGVSAAVAAAEAPLRVCEPIRIDLCRGMGYNETAMPTLVGHEVQSDADFTLQTFLPLIQYGCSAQLHFFLCAAYLPMCTPKVRVPIGPCRNLCETVRARCHPVLQGFGFPWPAALDCGRFPADNNHEHMCMEGPGEPGDTAAVGPRDASTGGAAAGASDGGAFSSAAIAAAAAAAAIASPGGGSSQFGGGSPPAGSGAANSVRHFTCHGLAKAHLYVRLNRSATRCAALCEANILFDQREKAAAEAWVTVWSVAALVTVITATLCLIVSDTKWDHILVPLVTCGSLVTVGWTVRWLAGRSRTACGIDAQYPGVSLLLINGMGNAPCAVTFLLRYYFGMAANVWWAILCLKWHFSVRRGRIVDYAPVSDSTTTTAAATSNVIRGNAHHHHHKRHHRNTGDVNIELLAVGCSTMGTNNALPATAAPPAKGAAGIKTTTAPPKRMQSLRNRLRSLPIGSYCSLTHLVAWGLPLIQTGAVIMAQLVDADELLGACFVGNQSDKALRVLVAMPLFCYWIFGSVNLFAGYLVQRREYQFTQLQQTNNHQQPHHPTNITTPTTAALPSASAPATMAHGISGMGTFLFIYSVPSAALMIAVFYEFANRDIWLNEPAAAPALDRSLAAASAASSSLSSSAAALTSSPAAVVKAAMWPFLLRAFMEVLVGVLAAGWVLAPRVSALWHSIQSRWLAVRGPPMQKIGVHSNGNGGIGAVPVISANNGLSSYRQPQYQLQPQLQHQHQQHQQQQQQHQQQYQLHQIQQQQQRHHHHHQQQQHHHRYNQQQPQTTSQHYLHTASAASMHSTVLPSPYAPHSYPHSAYSTASYQSVLCPQNSMVSLASSRTNGGAQARNSGYSAAANSGAGAHLCRPKGKKRSAGYRRSTATAQSVGLMAATGSESVL